MEERQNAKDFKKKPIPLSSAFVILATAFSNLSVDKELKLFRAMAATISKENKFKMDEDTLETVASILILAAEIRRTSTSK